MKKHFLSIFILGLFLFVPRASALDKPFDHSTWDQFLKKFVNENGEVNYAGAQKDPALLDAYLEQLREVKWTGLAQWPREELMALWMNAYHAALIKNILKYYPIKNVHEAPGFWEEDVLGLGGRLFSLNEIRSKHVFQTFRDAKIHTALSYAAKSGPKISRDAFQGPTVEGKLFESARNFINNEKENQIEPGKKAIYISKIFEWYPRDFNMDFGAFENDRGLSVEDFAILSFLVYYMDDDEKIRYLEDARYKIKYLPFDWTLNDWKPKAA